MRKHCNDSIPFIIQHSSYSIHHAAFIIQSAGADVNPTKRIPSCRSKKPLCILITNAGRKEDRPSYTYGISYAGKVRFGDEIDPYVTSVTACAGSYSYPLWILACEFNRILRMVFTQAYESSRLAKNIYHELLSQIPGLLFTAWPHGS